MNEELRITNKDEIFVPVSFRVSVIAHRGISLGN
jgi:hypothetical protein